MTNKLMGCVEASQIQADTNMSARTHPLALSAIKIVQHTKLKGIDWWNLLSHHRNNGDGPWLALAHF